jgi:hypothetical protein
MIGFMEQQTPVLKKNELTDVSIDVSTDVSTTFETELRLIKGLGQPIVHIKLLCLLYFSRVRSLNICNGRIF